MASIYGKDSGSWKEPKKVFVFQGTTPTKVKIGYHKRSGAWNEFFKSAVVPTNLIAFFDIGTDPSGVTLCDGTDGTPDLMGSFPRGAATVGTKQGADNHSTGASGNVETGASNTGMGEGYNSGQKLPSRYHTHTMGDHSHGSALHVPPYMQFVPNRMDTGNLPTGSHIFFRGNTAPTGWAFVGSSYEGRFVRCDSSAGSGGIATHTHPNATCSLSGNNGNHDTISAYVSKPSCVEGHNHSGSWDHGADAKNNNPVHVELRMMIAQVDSPDVPIGAVAFFSSAPPAGSGWAICDGVDDSVNYTDALVKIAAAYNDTKQGSDTHEDSSSGNIPYAYEQSAQIHSNNNNDWRTYDHTHDGYHSHGSASSLPVHTPVIIARKVA